MEAARALLADGDYWSSLELFLDAFESEQDGNLHGERACDEFHAALAGALEQLDLSADMGRFTALVAGVVRSRRRDAAALRMLAAKCLSAGVYPPAHCLLQAATKVTRARTYSRIYESGTTHCAVLSTSRIVVCTDSAAQLSFY